MRSVITLLISGLGLVFAGSVRAETASMPTGPAALGPQAASAFCQRSPRDCMRQGPLTRAMVLTSQRQQELETVNAAVNGAIAEVPDQVAFGRDDVWSLGEGGRGDCEDFALAKRRKLIELGWPSSVLLMTVVTTPSGEGHAVLTVVTDQGDFVLDNRTSSIRLWSSTGYEFFTRQAQASPARWVWIETGDLGTVASLPARRQTN